MASKRIRWGKESTTRKKRVFVTNANDDTAKALANLMSFRAFLPTAFVPFFSHCDEECGDSAAILSLIICFDVLLLACATRHLLLRHDWTSNPGASYWPSPSEGPVKINTKQDEETIKLQLDMKIQDNWNKMKTKIARRVQIQKIISWERGEA